MYIYDIHYFQSVKMQPEKRPLVKKSSWYDPSSGRNFSAGGVLLYDDYDDEGFYLLGETRTKDDIMYNDIGGKYTIEDCTIWQTIRRELYEETYGLVDVLVKDVVRWSTSYPLITIDAHGKDLKAFRLDKEPPVLPGTTYSYMCIVLPVSEIQRLTTLYEGKMLFTDEVNEELYSQARAEAIAKRSPKMEDRTPLCLKKIKYSEINHNDSLHGYRLKPLLPLLRELFPI